MTQLALEPIHDTFTTRVKDSMALLRTAAVLWGTWISQWGEYTRLRELSARERTVCYIPQRDAVEEALAGTARQLMEVLKPVICRLYRHKDWEFMFGHTPWEKRHRPKGQHPHVTVRSDHCHEHGHLTVLIRMRRGRVATPVNLTITW